MKKLLFVCRQNRNRSPIAQRMLKVNADKKGYDINVSSAGYELSGSRLISDQLNKILIRRGYGTLANHEPIALTPQMVAEAGLMLCMSPRQIDDICEEFPESKAKLLTLPRYVGFEGRVEDPNRLILNVVHPDSREHYFHHARIAHALPKLFARAYLHYFAGGRVANNDGVAVDILNKNMVSQIERYVLMAMPRLVKEGYLVKKE